MAGRTTALLALLLPLMVCGILLPAEIALSRDLTPQPLLESPELKQVVELNQELVKLFVTLATAVIGGVAYYIKSTDVFSRKTLAPASLATLTIVAAVLSIFFGHVFLANMRTQLALQRFNVHSSVLVWPERLQYISFLVALSWFALFAFAMERPQIEEEEDDE
jgi:hypothetical protein